jgi:hypothetical protein
MPLTGNSPQEIIPALLIIGICGCLIKYVCDYFDNKKHGS